MLFDEFHERSIHADLGLALTLEARETIREELRILVMSATIDAEAVAGLIGSEDVPAPIIECEGRTYPVEIQWRAMNKRDRIEHAVTAAVKAALATRETCSSFFPASVRFGEPSDQLRRAVDAEIHRCTAR